LAAGDFYNFFVNLVCVSAQLIRKIKTCSYEQVFIWYERRLVRRDDVKEGA